MKNSIYISLLFIFIFSCQSDYIETNKPFNQKHRLVDSSFLKNVQVDSIKVGYSTLTDLKAKGYQFNVAEFKKADSLISEFLKSENKYLIDSQKHIIVGTYKDSEIISCVWLLKNYSGNLLGKTINVGSYKVFEMLNDFQYFIWSTNGLSDYWRYKNNINHDTTVFYVQLDRSIERFPLNEKHYWNNLILGIKIKMHPWKIYGPEYGKLDTVLIKPLYAPLKETHLNYYLYRRKPGLKTSIREITSFGKKTNYEKIKIGKWLIYNSDHTLKSVEYYNNGILVK